MFPSMYYKDQCPLLSGFRRKEEGAVLGMYKYVALLSLIILSFINIYDVLRQVNNSQGKFGISWTLTQKNNSID